MSQLILRSVLLAALFCGADWAQTVPTINPGGVVEAAQFQPVVAPGSIASLFGQYLAGGTFQADTIPLPTELGSVQVTVNGAIAALFYVSNGQINFQIPFETAPGTANVVVNRNGVVGPAEPVEVRNYAPAAFRNSGLGIVVDNATGALIDAGNPATAGQIVRVYMNGFGQLDNTPASGAASPSDPLARTVVVPQVLLGDQPVTVYYSGLTPGLVGLGQIDMGLPAELPASLRDSLPLTIDFGGVIDEEELFVTLPEPTSPDVAIEITGVSPTSALPGDPIQIAYTIHNLTGYSGPADISFYLRLANTYAGAGKTTVELTGDDLSQSATATVNAALSAGSYSLGAQVTVEGDLNRANDIFEMPFVVESTGGEPGDLGVAIIDVSPLQIAPGGTLTFRYKLLNLSGYTGEAQVTFQLSTSSSGRPLLTETLTVGGPETDIVREVVTPQDLTPGAYRPVVLVKIDNDTDLTNNTRVFGETVTVTAASSLTSELPPGDAPPFGDLTEGNLSQWALEAYRGDLAVNPGVRLGQKAAASGASFLTGVAP
ncbi:MAG: hypothetical protein KDC27_02520, partial [Acidobacteria bacterium]|nr:hypothetical protein [Acidobacteriota bacterium]